MKYFRLRQTMNAAAATVFAMAALLLASCGGLTALVHHSSTGESGEPDTSTFVQLSTEGKTENGDEPEPPVYVAVTGISGVPDAATVGTDLTLTGTVAPSNTANREIIWNVSSAGGTGATISGSTFNATAAGTATITATIAGGGATPTANYTQDFTITVTTTAPAYVAVTGITGVPDAATVGTDLTLTGTVAPSNAANREIIWNVSSAGGTGATISGSTFNATAAGTATITATIAGGGATPTANYTRDFTITVTTATSRTRSNPSGATIRTNIATPFGTTTITLPNVSFIR